MTRTDHFDVLAGMSPPEGTLSFPGNLAGAVAAFLFVVIAAVPLVVALRRRARGRQRWWSVVVAAAGALGVLVCLFWTIAPVIVTDGWVVPPTLTYSRAGRVCMHEAIASLTPYGWNDAVCTSKSREYVGFLLAVGAVISLTATLLVHRLTASRRTGPDRELEAAASR